MAIGLGFRLLLGGPSKIVWSPSYFLFEYMHFAIWQVFLLENVFML